MADAEEQQPLQQGGTKGGIGRYRQSEKSQKNLLLVVGIVLCSIAIIIILMLIIAWLSKQGCATQECIMAASAIMAPMNLTADPCDDFYNYACGNWYTTIPSTGVKSWGPRNGAARKVYDDIYQELRKPDAKLNGESSTSIKKLKDFFAACMDEDAIEKRGNLPLEQMIKELGSWALTTSQTSGQFNAMFWRLEEALGVAHQQTQGPIFLLTSTDGGPPYTIRPTWHLHPFLYSHPAYEEAKKKEVQLIVRVAKLLNSPASEELLVEHGNKILDLHEELGSLIDMNCLWRAESMNVSQVQSLMGDWFILADYWEVLRGESWTPQDEVIVVCPDYFRRLGSVLYSRTSQPEIKSNAVVWSVVKSLIQTMGEEYRLAYQKHVHEFGFQDALVQNRYRWEECLQQTMEAFPAAVYAMFIDSHYDRSSTKDVERMSSAVIDTYLDHVYNADWMDESEQEREYDSVSGMPHLIGYPPSVLDRAKLDAEYQGYNVTPDNFNNHKLMTKEKTARGMSGKYGTGGSGSEFRDYHTLNDYMTIVHDSDDYHVPAGIMQRTFYSSKFPGASNYGGLGAEIGRVFADDVMKMVVGEDDPSIFDWLRDDNDTSKANDERAKKDCGYKGITRHLCLQKGCEWEEEDSNDGNTPLCFLKRPKFIFPSLLPSTKTTTPQPLPSRGDRSVASHSRSKRDVSVTKKDELMECLDNLYEDSDSVSDTVKARRYEELFDEGVTLQLAHEAYLWKARRWDKNRLAGLEPEGEQIFFVGYAQGMCEYLNPSYSHHSNELTAKEKVTQSVMNSKAFASTFACPVGSKMNPDAPKCVVFD